MRHTFRYVVPHVAPGAHVTLDARDGHHLLRVVRRRAGDEVELIDGEGAIWPARVADLGPPVVVVAADRPRPAPPALPVTLAVGLADAGRLDLLVEKATELGVPEIRFFRSERARRAPDAAAFDARRRRMLRVAESAARQAGHGRLPAIPDLAGLDATVADAGACFALDPRAVTGLGAAVGASGAAHVTVLVGPDAGFSDAELDRLAAAGATAVRLGPATLRTETAAIVAAAVAAEALGALGSPPRPGPSAAG